MDSKRRHPQDSLIHLQQIYGSLFYEPKMRLYDWVTSIDDYYPCFRCMKKERLLYNDWRRQAVIVRRDYNINELINKYSSGSYCVSIAYLWSRYKNDTKSRMCNNFYGMVYCIGLWQHHPAYPHHVCCCCNTVCTFSHLNGMLSEKRTRTDKASPFSLSRIAEKNN